MKWVNNIKIAPKLVAAFIVIALFIVLVGSIGIYNMKKLNANSNSMYENNFKSVLYLSNIKKIVWRFELTC